MLWLGAELFLAAFFAGRLNLPALQGVGPPELILVSGADRLGILNEECQHGFSAKPASFPLRLLPLPDPVLVTVLAEDLESFRPAEPLLPLLFFGPGDLTLLEAAAASSAARQNLFHSSADSEGV